MGLDVLSSVHESISANLFHIYTVYEHKAFKYCLRKHLDRGVDQKLNGITAEMQELKLFHPSIHPLSITAYPIRAQNFYMFYVNIVFFAETMM